MRSSRFVDQSVSSNAWRAAPMARSMSSAVGVGDLADDVLGRRVDVREGASRTRRRRASRRSACAAPPRSSPHPCARAPLRCRRRPPRARVIHQYRRSVPLPSTRADRRARSRDELVPSARRRSASRRSLRGAHPREGDDPARRRREPRRAHHRRGGRGRGRDGAALQAARRRGRRDRADRVCDERHAPRRERRRASSTGSSARPASTVEVISGLARGRADLRRRSARA